MLTVALVGADGAGKTTIGRRLESELGVPTVYLYMGVNTEAGTHLLPTSRLIQRVKRARGAPPDTAGPPDPLAVRQRADGARSGTRRARALRSLRGTARVSNRMAEEWYQQGIVWWHRAHRRAVVLDRHYLADFYAHDMSGGARLPLSRRVHGAVLSRLYPQPDLVVLLDAAPEVLYARKGEGTPESLARRREEYLSFGRYASDFEIVDVDRPVDDVVAAVADLVTKRIAARRLAAVRSRRP